jgi:hypothetical protein
MSSVSQNVQTRRGSMQLTPRGFIDAIESGTSPHDALVQWGRQRRQRTEKLQKIRLEAINKQKSTGPLEIADTPTELIQNIKLSQVMSTDEGGRPYLALNDRYGDSVDLAEYLVLKYRDMRREYPAVIILSALRYIARQEDYFILGNRYIPYIYEPDTGFEFQVAVRGGNWML